MAVHWLVGCDVSDKDSVCDLIFQFPTVQIVQLGRIDRDGPGGSAVLTQHALFFVYRGFFVPGNVTGHSLVDGVAVLVFGFDGHIVLLVSGFAVLYVHLADVGDGVGAVLTQRGAGHGEPIVRWIGCAVAS